MVLTIRELWIGSLQEIGQLLSSLCFSAEHVHLSEDPSRDSRTNRYGRLNYESCYGKGITHPTLPLIG